MQIIVGMEDQPRGIYTGAIAGSAPAAGRVSASRSARCSSTLRKGIRRRRRTRRPPLVSAAGSPGLPDPAAEYCETAAKAALLFESRPDFRLLESMLWLPDEGIFLLERHLARLLDSARYSASTPTSADRGHVGRAGPAAFFPTAQNFACYWRRWRVGAAERAVGPPCLDPGHAMSGISLRVGISCHPCGSAPTHFCFTDHPPRGLPARRRRTVRPG